jgi:hypothetical protein
MYATWYFVYGKVELNSGQVGLVARCDCSGDIFNSMDDVFLYLDAVGMLYGTSPFMNTAAWLTRYYVP